MKLSSCSIRFLVIALTLLATSAVHAQMGRPLPVVLARKPTTVTEGEARTYIGSVKAAEIVNMTAKVNGTLWKVAFKEGSIVKKGDLLFEIEDTVYKANLEIAQASLQQKQAELDYANTEYERNKKLFEKKVISDSEFASYVKEKKTLEADILQCKANIRLCENNLSYTKIYAPLAGRIGDKLVSEGNEVGTSAGILATIVQYDPIKIRFSMSEADFYKNFKDGKLVDHTMVIRDAADKELAGGIKIDFFDSTVDASTDTVMIQLLCPNASNAIVPGGFVKISFTKKYATPMVAVPTSAVMNEGANQYLYIVGSNDTVERRAVQTGDLVNDLQVITSGLNPDELVITGGNHKTAPGGKVKVVMSTTEAPATK